MGLQEAFYGLRVASVPGFEGYPWVQGRSRAAQNLMKVLIIYADANIYPAGLRQSIVTQAGVGQVDAYNGATGTPSLSQLMFYDVVVAYSNSLFSNSTILGDNLALYQDNGGVVVPMVFSFTDSYNISGDWWAVGYSPFNLGTNRFVAATLGSFVSGHPLMIGVDTLNAYFRSTTTLAPGAAQVATSTSIQAVSMGYGFAWLPEEHIREELKTGLLRPLPLREGGSREVPLYMILANPDFVGPGVRRLAEISRETVEIFKAGEDH